MRLPGFTADVSLYSSRQHLHSVLSKDVISGVYPAKLKDENEGVNCDTCVGGQCVALGCLGDGGIFDPEPCLNTSECSACVPTGPSIFSPGRQFCTTSFCTPGFNGSCRCRVFKGFQTCQVPRPVLTAGFRR